MNSNGIGTLPPEITASNLSKRLKVYSFIECQQILAFLTLVANRKPDSKDLFWIKGKVRACLNSHDNGSEYFETLRNIEKELIKASESLSSKQ
ncbi:TPA: hypothetical protein KWI17_004746 [Enterobacter cloacae]|nr:hypothetical protein [Enterobacter cloacae]HBH7069288.1 hypothetical protein [Enterobacter cloacae]